MKSAIREIDAIVRYGGDEFLVIMPQTERQIGNIRTRIDVRVESLNKSEENLGFELSLSIGGAYWNPDGDETLEEVIAQADHSMYKHKAEKRSQIP